MARRMSLLTGCTCGKLTVEWRKVDGVWRGKCTRVWTGKRKGEPNGCGFSTRASTGDGWKLDDRAGVPRG